MLDLNGTVNVCLKRIEFDSFYKIDQYHLPIVSTATFHVVS